MKSAAAATLIAATFVLLGCAAADDPEPPPCSHQQALSMGSMLHGALDVEGYMWREMVKTEAGRKTAAEALTKLMDASKFALRGDDAEACQRYRAIATEYGVGLD